MRQKITSALLVISLALLTGCEEDPCSLTTLSAARFDFRDSQTHQAVTLTEGATVTGIADIDGKLDVDTVFNQAKSYMTVPMSYTHKTTYVMHYTERMRDTIEVTHRNIPFVSNIECGTVMKYEVENIRYTTNALDSVTIVNPEIDNEEKTNFNIYYRVTDTE